MDNLIDEIVFIIYDNYNFKNPVELKLFLSKLYSKLEIVENDSINIEDTDDESESDEEINSSDEDFIDEGEEETSDSDISDLEAEELKIIITGGFSKIK